MSKIIPAAPARAMLVLAAVAISTLACAGVTQPVPTVPRNASPAAATTQTDGVTDPTPAGPGSTDATASPRFAPVEHTPLPPGPSFKLKAYASRVVVPDLRIDLPVVSGDLQPPPSYPYCDVASYVTRFTQPYEKGITYISAHAQKGMFLPLLSASEVNDGASLIGQKVQVYVSDGRLFEYTVRQVVRHAIDYSIIESIPLDQQTLILQTSEGVYGTVQKLQVVATLSGQTTVDLATANPMPQPRACEPLPSASPAGSTTP